MLRNENHILGPNLKPSFIGYCALGCYSTSDAASALKASPHSNTVHTLCSDDRFSRFAIKGQKIILQFQNWLRITTAILRGLLFTVSRQKVKNKEAYLTSNTFSRVGILRSIVGKCSPYAHSFNGNVNILDDEFHAVATTAV